MDEDERQHLEKLRKVLVRRLRVLELQAARKGDPPPDLLMEMEDLCERIAEVDAKLPKPNIGTSPNVGVGLPEKTLHIVLNIDYAEWNPDLQAAALRALAAVMDVSPDKVKIMDVQSGSVRITLRVPEYAADRLLELYESGHPIIHDLYIENAIMLKELGPEVFAVWEGSTEDEANEQGGDLMHGKVTGSVMRSVDAETGKPSETGVDVSKENSEFDRLDSSEQRARKIFRDLREKAEQLRRQDKAKANESAETGKPSETGADVSKENSEFDRLDSSEQRAAKILKDIHKKAEQLRRQDKAKANESGETEDSEE